MSACLLLIDEDQSVCVNPTSAYPFPSRKFRRLLRDLNRPKIHTTRFVLEFELNSFSMIRFELDAGYFGQTTLT